MNYSEEILSCATELEGILRNYLECNRTEFGVKANDKLRSIDWKSPINFALGVCYANSKKDPKVKEEIDFFLGEELEGQSIADVIENYENYGIVSKDAALEKVKTIIGKLKKILEV